MKHLSACAALLLATMFATTARAELVNCADRDGHITITDTPCAPASAEPRETTDETADVTQTPIQNDIAPSAEAAAKVAKSTLAAGTRRPRATGPGTPPPYPRLNRPTTSEPFGIDTNTLRAARAALDIDDNAHRSHQLASR